jgi:hypothetical protein
MCVVCYVVPTFAALVHLGFRSSWGKYHKWLSLLLAGGAIFGVIDHLWNRELFLIGPNIFNDLLLGLVITLAIIVIWGVLVAIDKSTDKSPERVVS